MRRGLAACVLSLLLAVGSAGTAEALGNLPCGSAETAETVDLGTGPVSGNGIFVIVAGTSERLEGATLGARIEVHRLSDGALIACNDDHGSDFGGCSQASTMLMENFTFNLGPRVL
jgi:hypothetical protein